MGEPRQKGIKDAEKAVNRAFSTGKVDRAEITRSAQLDAAEAVTMAGIAMESDAEADEAAKLAIIAANIGNREKTKTARERERTARVKAKADHKAATKSAKRAYEAIKYSDPNSLGFLRVVQFLFLFHIVGTLLALILTSRDTVVYDSSNISDWILVVLEAVAFYFFVNRYKLGRPFVIGMASLSIVTNGIVQMVNGTFSILSLLFSNLYYVFLIVYFCTSDRVRATLVNDLSSDKGALDDDDFIIDRRSWPFYRNLIIYFVIFSVLGHWMEAAFCQLIRLGIVAGDFDINNTMLWRDWLYPYPMHGTAVVLIAVGLYPLFTWMKKHLSSRWKAYVVSFLLNMATCTLIEFVGGLMFNANLQNWNYSDLPFNFMGQICLQNAIGFGFASSIIAWWVYPMLERAIARVRPATMNIVCIVVAVAGGILFSLYAISPPEGIDLGQKSVEMAQEEERVDVTNLTTGYASTAAIVEGMQDTLTDSTTLTDEEKEQIQKCLDELDADLSQMSDVLQNAKEAKVPKQSE